MRAIVCTRLGPPEALEIEDRPTPELMPGSLLVDVAAAGVNFVDTLFIQGLYQIKPQPPFVPGSEIAGVVRAVAGDVSGFREGDRVMAMTGLGGFAEQVVVAAKSATRVPDGLDLETAAGFIQSYCTGLFALRNRGGLEPGETLLVLGAGGGTGMAAIALGKAMGARVIAAASSEAKLAACSAQGADELIDYSKDDLKARAKALGGVDVVYDPVGGEYAEPALRSLRPNGRYLVIGFATGEIPRVPFNLMLLKQCQVVGVDWGGWSAKNPEQGAELLPALAELIADGRLHPAPPETRPLESAPAALRELMERRAVGKLVLTTAPA